MTCPRATRRKVSSSRPAPWAWASTCAGTASRCAAPATAPARRARASRIPATLVASWWRLNPAASPRHPRPPRSMPPGLRATRPRPRATPPLRRAGCPRPRAMPPRPQAWRRAMAPRPRAMHPLPRAMRPRPLAMPPRPPARPRALASRPRAMAPRLHSWPPRPQAIWPRPPAALPGSLGAVLRLAAALGLPAALHGAAAFSLRLLGDPHRRQLGPLATHTATPPAPQAAPAPGLPLRPPPAASLPRGRQPPAAPPRRRVSGATREWPPTPRCHRRHSTEPGGPAPSAPSVRPSSPRASRCVRWAAAPLAFPPRRRGRQAWPQRASRPTQRPWPPG
mmetsp:Transcript_48000/g.148281  ORF Transcript_48000/g.148281 Transcript_48000/m.148281 type:complete len:336 (+) Transcript_48000:421-1428(+)